MGGGTLSLCRLWGKQLVEFRETGTLPFLPRRTRKRQRAGHGPSTLAPAQLLTPWGQQ